MPNAARDRAVLAAGAVSGVFAGLGAILLPMIRAGLEGEGFWRPLRLVSATLLGLDAMTAGPVAVLVGLLIQVTLSAALGIVFASLLRTTATAAQAVAGGLIYGIAVWAIMTYIGLPIFNPILWEQSVATAPAWWFLYHLIFGVMLFPTPSLMRRWTRVTANTKARSSDRRAA